MLGSAWRVHVAPRWASVAVSRIDQLAVESWISTMTQGGAGATTVLRAHGVLSGILGDAVKAKRLASNPTATECISYRDPKVGAGGSRAL